MVGMDPARLAERARQSGVPLSFTDLDLAIAETEAQVDPDPVLSDHAERAYLDAREISAVRAEPAPPTEPPEPDQANPDPPESEAAPSVDKRA